MKGPDPSRLPDAAAERAGDVLAGVSEVLSSGVESVGSALAEILPQAVAVLAVVV